MYSLRSKVQMNYINCNSYFTSDILSENEISDINNKKTANLFSIASIDSRIENFGTNIISNDFFIIC